MGRPKGSKDRPGTVRPSRGPPPNKGVFKYGQNNATPPDGISPLRWSYMSRKSKLAHRKGFEINNGDGEEALQKCRTCSTRALMCFFPKGDGRACGNCISMNSKCADGRHQPPQIPASEAAYPQTGPTQQLLPRLVSQPRSSLRSELKAEPESTPEPEPYSTFENGQREDSEMQADESTHVHPGPLSRPGSLFVDSQAFRQGSSISVIAPSVSSASRRNLTVEEEILMGILGNASPSKGNLTAEEKILMGILGNLSALGNVKRTQSRNLKFEEEILLGI